MPRHLLAAVLAVVVLLGLAPSAPAAATPEAGPLVFAPAGVTTDRFAPATTPERVDVAAHDGVTLHTRVFRPDTSADPEWRTPVILVHSPYYPGTALESANRSMDIVGYFTPKGYTVVLSDVRGTGLSGGCLDQDGPDQARDFRTLVEHFADQPWSNGAVGSYGKSYDAETQHAGAVLRPRGLKTMISVAGISGLYDVGYYDGVPLAGNGLLSAAVYAGPSLAITDPENATRAHQRVDCQPANFTSAADPSGDLSPYWADREFRLKVDEVEASTLYVMGLSDFTVAPLAIDGWYDELKGFKRAIFGQWGHYYPYDAPDELARDDWYDSIHAWLDAELLDLDTGITQWPQVQVQSEDGTWRATPSFAGMGAEQLVPLGAQGALGTPGPAGSTATYAETSSTSFTGPELTAPLHLSGQAVLEGLIALDRPDGHFAVTLEEVSASGTARTLTRGYLSAVHRESLIRQVPVQPGHATPYRIRTYPFDKTLAAGSRLRVVLAGFDDSTLPAGTGYTATVATDGRSVLRLPVAQDQCGMAVATRQPARGPILDCPDGVPSEAPTADIGPDGYYVATDRIIRSQETTVGGVAAVRDTGYLKVRDGVELAFEVIRPAGDGPFPTLLTYDGYAAGADPDSGYAARYLPRGYALVGLNLRGTSCSGGIFDFFQPAEGRDGYEMVEWIARQPWSNERVAMVGKSYPGITQLFVAEQRPPHLVAIAPGHYFGDAYRDIAFPGGIFNYAFASLWSFVAQPAPGMAALPGELQAQDETCARHQEHHATNARTNPFVQAQEHPHDDALIRERSPLYALDQIDVPVYSALSWQDEQLMSRQTHVLTAFERLGIEYRAVLSNGDHGMYRRGPQMAELDRFFEAHLEQRSSLRDGTPRGAYLNEPPVTVFWEQHTGEPRWRTTHRSWGDLASAERLYLGADGALTDQAPTTGGSDTYAHAPVVSSQGIGNPKYGSVPHDRDLWADYAPPEGAALAYTSAPFAKDTTLLGPASADLWVTATAPNVDLQVTITEVRPDGQEVFVNQGWLRADQRRLDVSRSTALLPVSTHEEADVAPLSPTEPSLVRIEVLPFGHVVRDGSRLRVWVEAPTVIPQLEGFALDPTPAAVTVVRDGDHQSSIALPVLRGTPLPQTTEDLPACGTVLRQPCRQDPRG